MFDETDMMPFGHLPFDYYVMDKWDPNSSVTEFQQFRALVESWTRLGKSGRNEYPDGDDLFPEEIPPYVPQDLMSDDARATDGQTTRLLWIRTWFGRKDDQTSQNAADAGYKRLRTIVSQHGLDACLEKECIFESKEEFGPGSITMPHGDKNPDFVDGVACGTPGSVPSYMITALMHKPDILDGLTARDWPSESYKRSLKPDMAQCLMLVLADRKACEEGWVLFLAVNHKGEVLPFRVRETAYWTSQLIMEFMNGQDLDENTEDPDEDIEYYNHRGDGWAPDTVS
ncbi:hypothetical protein PENARI_c052G03806 [Penicillium arizonense]|uniref:Uncharacterized protein n=1 Tax=Penicillium arizonense TaxID=1835702 RepID=A0A1F5L1Z5_PENAI|nr:hypothetical protein PENARI_c052G03806 [Penicillium arizonense]OGE47258.1 hypothetical protein PENARI_c052G03806 [Penicillium arizonense]